MTIREIIEHVFRWGHSIPHTGDVENFRSELKKAENKTLSELKAKFEQMMTLHPHNYTDASESGCEECIKNQAILNCADECK